jgi:hypothetical protein
MRKTISIGKVSSFVLLIIAVCYGLLQILSSLKLIHYPGNFYWFFAPSLLLAPAFLVTTVCFDILTPDRLRGWTITAWVLATIDCMMIVMVYFSQPGLLNPSHFNWKAADFNVTIFQHHTALIDVKYVHYFLISASTFVLTFGTRKRDIKFFSRGLLLNSLMITALVISYIYKDYYFLLFGWFFIFPFAVFPVNQFFILKQRKLNIGGNIKFPIEWIIQ